MRGVEEVGAEVAVEQQHRDCAGDHGDRDDQQQRVGEDRPDEQRQARPAHPRRAHVRDRHVEVDRAQQRGDAGEVDQVDPGIDATGWKVGGAGERHRRDPARLGRAPEDRRVEHDAAGEEQPVGERVQSRERHVARADHQRDEVVAEARQHRHDEQEDHRRPVHREELVVDLRADERVVRLAELQANHQRLAAAEDEERERRDQVEDPDPLVVGCREPAHQAAGLVLGAVSDDLWNRS